MVLFLFLSYTTLYYPILLLLYIIYYYYLVFHKFGWLCILASLWGGDYGVR
jgi:hypothetical protein